MEQSASGMRAPTNPGKISQIVVVRRPFSHSLANSQSVIQLSKIGQQRHPLSEINMNSQSVIHLSKIGQQRHPLSEINTNSQPVSQLILSKNSQSVIQLPKIVQKRQPLSEINSNSEPISQLKSKVVQQSKSPAQFALISSNPTDDAIFRAREVASKCISEVPASYSKGSSNNPVCVNFKESESQNEKFSHDETVIGKEAQATSSEDTEYLSLSDDDFQPKRKNPTKTTRNGNSSQDNLLKDVGKRPVAGCRMKQAEIASAIKEIKERSISNSLFEKVHEGMPSLMADYVVLECSVTENPFNADEEHWMGKIRANIRDKKEALQWLSEYEKVSVCDFRVRKTKQENSKRLIFKREYRCHFRTMPRSKKNPSDDIHSKSKKGYRESKNTDCPSFIRITIKQTNMHWSSDVLLDRYPCEIVIQHNHNHPIMACDVVRHRRPSPETREKFLKLFADGHSPMSAIECHKFDLMMESRDQYTFSSGDGSKCPSNFWVYKLFREVSVGVYGPQTGVGMVESLKEFSLKYNAEMNSDCMKVELYKEKDLIVSICSPMMKRTHELLRASGEIMFVDSSGSMDALNSRVFLLMTPSVVGALPLGILVTSSETEEVLRHGLDTWKTLLPPRAFYGRGAAKGPKLGMTDDCSSERNALKYAFPGIILLLCLFHVLQAFWRYIWKREQNVDEKDRPEIFFAFKDLVYTKDKEVFSQEVEGLKTNTVLLSYPKIHDHILKFIDRSLEWALCHRNDLLTRDHNTDNYNEASMRLLKDKVLGRIRAFNTVQLVDFLVTRFEAFIELRVTDILNNRALHPFKSRYFIHPDKLKNLSTEKLPSYPDCYLVRNKDKNTKYVVSMDHEICSCPEGQRGKPCKHQCAVVKDFQLSSQQFLPSLQTGAEMKLILFEILHGHRNVPDGWFRGLKAYIEAPKNSNSMECEDQRASSPNEEFTSQDCALSDEFVPQQDFSAEKVQEIKRGLEEMFQEWSRKLQERPDVFLEPFQNLTEFNAKVKNSDSALTSALMTVGKQSGPAPLSVRKRNQCTIPVQPTAKGRRKVYLEGRKAHPGGRPPNGTHKSIPEHNYNSLPTSKLSKRNHDDPSWVALPKKRRSAAPHAMLACVNANRMIGGNHQKK